MVEPLSRSRGPATFTSGALCNQVFPGLEQETSVFSHIGGRRNQEDRFCVCPSLSKEVDGISLYGVFDGTVGDLASDTVKDLVVPALMKTEGFQRYVASRKDGDKEKEHYESWMRAAVREMYLKADEELLRLVCVLTEKQQHRDFASTTSVTLLLWEDMICVGHLGDSRICLMYVADESLDQLETARAKKDKKGGGEKTASSEKIVTRSIQEDMVLGSFVTKDHKPSSGEERRRIEQNGGSVEYLHNHQNKPFIRGGDFQRRKALGESPMQLQYSRAFGGKDLKPYGLTADPTVNVTSREKQFLGFILASDGLWDLLSADEAAGIAFRAYQEKKCPAETLVKTVLPNAGDNVTAITLFYDHLGGAEVSTSSSK